MDEESLISFLKGNFLPISLGLVGVVFVGIGAYFALSKQQDQNSLKFEPASNQASKPTSPQPKIVVDIEGEVLKPGIYQLPPDSRIHDLLVASGGLSEEADRDWASKSLNQAAKLSDGQKIYVPKIGEAVSASATQSQSSAADQSTTALISINSASLKDLDTLPGIGPVTAQKIVDGRPYSSLNELLSKKAVTSSVFDKIKDKISLN